ncbi:MAG: protein translocase subunit SecF [Candidatus Magnetoovum sp. WYHC-5]|nr:protein translocase subunit SecF [Candidatus Magnetoovum sp. WYHC-5]
MIELLKNTQINFMGKKNIALLLSAIVSIIGIIGIVQIARGSANLGIDFAGGTVVQLKFNKNVDLSQVRKALETDGIRNFELQDMPTIQKVSITIKQEEDTQYSDKVINALRAGLKDTDITVDSVSTIGPKVGKQLRIDAMWAIIAATVGILIYVTWRFQFRFSIGATVATFHDVLAVLAVFYVFGREMNLILVTALLTIAGYSLTDTVVVFDRIRENLRKNIREPVEDVINRSINEVLSRTIITSLTTFLSAAALFFFGGEVIHDFALAMLIGIIIGTYSSIFVASPVVLLWRGDRPLVKR